MSLKSFFYDRLLLIGILVTAALILWWLTDDIIVALVCLFSLIIISFIARLYQPWNEEKVIEKLNIQNKNHYMWYWSFFILSNEVHRLLLFSRQNNSSVLLYWYSTQ